MKKLAVLLVSVIFLPVLAYAEEGAEGTFAIQEVKVTSGVDNKMPVDDKTSFATGEKAWVWLKLEPKSDTATMMMKWYWNGNLVWTMDPKPVKLGRTWYNKSFDQPGEWKVEILDDKSTVLKTATLTVTGEPVAAAPAPTTATESTSTTATGSRPTAAAEPKPDAGDTTATAGTSDHLAVVELKFAEEIKDRDPVNPTTTFNKGAKVFGWAKLNVKDQETQIKMRWLVDDAAIYTSEPVTVKQSETWRTWSFKTVDTAGNWKLEILDAEDKPVFAQAFTVQ